MFWCIYTLNTQRFKQNAEKGKTVLSIKLQGETTQKQVKQHCLYSEQFMDSKGLQSARLYIWTAGQMEGFETACTSGWLLTALAPQGLRSFVYCSKAIEQSIVGRW